MRSKAGTTFIVLGFLTISIGLLNILTNLSSGTMNDPLSPTIGTFGLVLNGAIYIMPGLILMAIGYVIAAVEENTRSQEVLQKAFLNRQELPQEKPHSATELDYGQEAKKMFTEHPWLKEKLKVTDYLTDKENKKFDYKAIYFNAKHLVNPSVRADN